MMENNRMVQFMRSLSVRGKKRVMVIAAAVCCLAILATGTLAYFTAEETAYNVITTGALSMDLVEETTGGLPWPEEGVSGVVPGSVVDKIAYVVNDGSVEFYARIAVEMTITAADGSELPADDVELDFNTEKWTAQDGYYYYNDILTPGAATEPLFTKVTFSPRMGNAYMNARVEIDVHAQAVQSRNNGASALTATGWTDAE